MCPIRDGSPSRPKAADREAVRTEASNCLVIF